MWLWVGDRRDRWCGQKRKRTIPQVFLDQPLGGGWPGVIMESEPGWLFSV